MEELDAWGTGWAAASVEPAWGGGGFKPAPATCDVCVGETNENDKTEHKML